MADRNYSGFQQLLKQQKATILSSTEQFSGLPDITFTYACGYCGGRTEPAEGNGSEDFIKETEEDVEGLNLGEGEGDGLAALSEKAKREKSVRFWIWE